MLLDATLRILNHLVMSERWASERLQAFAGRLLRLEFGRTTLDLCILPDGRFGTANGVPEVTIKLPADAPLRLLRGQSALLAAVQINGAADLAEALGFVFRNLRWDVEDDLAHWVGDIAAHRFVQSGRKLAQWPGESLARLGKNFAEYLTEENPSIARADAVAAFCEQSRQTEQKLAQLEKRLESLESTKPFTSSL